MKKKTTDKYIKKPREVVAVILRMEKSFKELVQKEADRMGTSMNSFFESSARYYIDRLNGKD